MGVHKLVGPHSSTRVGSREVHLGKVLVNGADAGLNQIQTGLAWHYKKYEREQSSEDRVAYARAEETARAGRRGLWRDPRPVPPWEFRRH